MEKARFKESANTTLCGYTDDLMYCKICLDGSYELAHPSTFYILIYNNWASLPHSLQCIRPVYMHTPYI